MEFHVPSSISGASRAGVRHLLIHVGGTESFDGSDIINWVTQGKTPDQIVATKQSNGQVVRSRALCAYPMVSRYKGTGSEDDAASYVCAK